MGLDNYYTERLIEQVRAEFGADFWGFWMLGGMSGGGMGFMFAPARKAEAQERLQRDHVRDEDANLQPRCPFAMEPVVYDFRASTKTAPSPTCSPARTALMPEGYYTLTAPAAAAADRRNAAAAAPRGTR